MAFYSDYKVQVIKEEKDGSSIAFAVEPSFPLPSKMRIGVDPGTRNLGIAVIRPKLVKLYKITLERKETALDRMLDVQRVLGDTIGHFTPDSVAIIEGASYYGYRQVELAEQRAATALWFCKFGIEVHIIPPLKIRKQVFGNSKEKNPWGIEDNCAAALACALFSSQDIN